QNTNIYVGGRFYIGLYDEFFMNGTNCDNVMRIDGAGYGQLLYTGVNSNVNAIAVMGTNVHFSGYFTSASNIVANRIALWDGNNWSSVGGGVTGNGLVNALAVIGGNLYAGGTFTNMGGVAVNRIAKWDGTNWTALGSGMTYPGVSSAPVNALQSVGADLYAG